MKEYQNFTEAFYGNLLDLKSHGELCESVSEPGSVGSGFGKKDRPTKEIIKHTFMIKNPVDRHLRNAIRSVDDSFCYANAIWTLAGSNSLDFIRTFNQRGDLFSDDGIFLNGAHGFRLINELGINQIQNNIDRIKADSHTRRAVSIVWTQRDSHSSSKDIPCIESIQFLLRQNKLHCIVNMRSQSAAMVLPYDLFLFTFIQEYVARMLEVEVGHYYHSSGSFHYYLDEEPLVETILTNPDSNITIPESEVPSMPIDPNPKTTIYSIYKNVLCTMRRDGEVCKDTYPSYWQNIYDTLTHSVETACKK